MTRIRTMSATTRKFCFFEIHIFKNRTFSAGNAAAHTHTSKRWMRGCPSIPTKSGDFQNWVQEKDWREREKNVTEEEGTSAESGVARWFNYKPKIPIWIYLGKPRNGTFWYILWLFRISYGHLVYFMTLPLVYFGVIWYIFRVLVCCTKKNLATPEQTIVPRLSLQ
jgi:hypothetical protein